MKERWAQEFWARTSTGAEFGTQVDQKVPFDPGQVQSQHAILRLPFLEEDDSDAQHVEYSIHMPNKC
jgi:hypothetical protein